MATRPLSAQATRTEQILSEATSLFHEHGYNETSLDDVAAAVGFTKAAIYHYFPGKTEILYQIRRRIGMRAVEELRALLDGPGTAAERVTAALEAHVRMVVSNIEAWTVFHETRGTLKGDDREGIRELEREYEQRLRDLYEEGRVAGTLADVEPALAIATLLGACNWVYRWYRGEPVDAFSRRVVSVIARGYLRDTPRA